MKKILFAIPVILLVAAGCNSTQPTVEQAQPTPTPQQQVSQTPTPTPTPVQPTPTPTPTSTPTPTTTGQLNTYINSQVGFSLTLPKGWFLPSTTDNDPHFYETQACSNQDRIDCLAIEISQSSYSASQIDQALSDAIGNGGTPTKTTSLISGATVIKGYAPGAAEGWSYEYDVFFIAQNKTFTIFTNDKKLETSVLPTFKLAK